MKRVYKQVSQKEFFKVLNQYGPLMPTYWFKPNEDMIIMASVDPSTGKKILYKKNYNPRPFGINEWEKYYILKEILSVDKDQLEKEKQDRFIKVSKLFLEHIPSEYDPKELL